MCRGDGSDAGAGAGACAGDSLMAAASALILTGNRLIGDDILRGLCGKGGGTMFFAGSAVSSMLLVASGFCCCCCCRILSGESSLPEITRDMGRALGGEGPRDDVGDGELFSALFTCDMKGELLGDGLSSFSASQPGVCVVVRETDRTS